MAKEPITGIPRVLSVKATVITPSVPNFIRCADGQNLPLSAFEDDGLRQIAAAWTDALLENAARQRKAAK